MKQIIFLLLLFVVATSAFARFTDKLPVNWGKIAADEFSIVPKGTDAQAPAIVLCDFGNIEITNRTFYTRHIRIKILNEQGLQYASVEIPYEVKDKHDVFYELKAQTLVMENGKIVKYKVAPGQIEDLTINEKWHKKKFTFPHAAPGAIIEYHYVIASLDFEKLDNWYFQREIPTIWSELRFDVPPPYVYLVSFENNRELAPDEEAVFGQKLQWMYDTKTWEKRSELANNKYILFNTGENRFKVWALNDMKKKIVMKNLPGLSSVADGQPLAYHYPQVRFDLFESSGNLPRAFRPLLITTHDDYETRGEWSLMQDNSAVMGYVHYRLKTWSQFNESLLNNERFGQYLMKKSDGMLQSEINSSGSNELEQIASIIHFVQKNFQWNGTFSMYATQNFKSFTEKRTGSSAELNLLLVNLLRQHGFKSDPVLIRTADLGQPEKLYPVKNQFNHVIASAEIGGRLFLFDATNSSSDLNRLNKLDIETQGWIVNNDHPGWVETYTEGNKKEQESEIPFFSL
jgi:hypothetical protein